MSSFIFRNFICPVGNVNLAREIFSTLGGIAGQNMLVVPLYTSDRILTHYISTGLISAAFEPILNDAEALTNACIAAGLDITLENIQDLLTTSNITEGNPHDAIAILNLSLHQVNLYN